MFHLCSHWSLSYGMIPPFSTPPCAVLGVFSIPPEPWGCMGEKRRERPIAQVDVIVLGFRWCGSLGESHPQFHLLLIFFQNFQALLAYLLYVNVYTIQKLFRMNEVAQDDFKLAFKTEEGPLQRVPLLLSLLPAAVLIQRPLCTERKPLPNQQPHGPNDSEPSPHLHPVAWRMLCAFSGTCTDSPSDL